jgi:hypothetical protein
VLFVNGIVNLHRIDWSEYSGAIVSQQHVSPSPVLWSISCIESGEEFYYMIDCGEKLTFVSLTFVSLVLL